MPHSIDAALNCQTMKKIAKLLLLIALVSPFNAFALFEECKELFPNQEIPTTTQTGRDLCFDDFAIYYSPLDKKPIYVVEILNGAQLLAPHPRRTNQFYEEARLPFKERALLSDYRGSGYDRGHNVPAGDMTKEKGMAQSFSLANIMPQARQNNQGIWAKNVEEPTRQYAKRSSNNLYVYTGSTGSIGTIGKNAVTIPSHIFKLVYDPNKKLAWAYWVENSNEAKMSPPISYAQLIQKTGIDFHLPIATEDAPAKVISTTMATQGNKVGGWYPVFFDQYLADKVDEIISKIKDGKVLSVQIQYDRNADLAKHIARHIESQTSMTVTLIQSSPPESATVSYERNRVVTIIHSK